MARTYASMGIPWYSWFNKDSLDDILSRCVPGRVHILGLLAALFTVSGIKVRSLKGGTLINISLSILSLLLIEETLAGLSVTAIPLLAYLQFPWRFLAVFNLFAAAAVAACFSKASPIPENGKSILALTLSFLCLFVYFPDLPDLRLRRSRTETRDGIRASLTTLDHENKYMPRGAKLFEEPVR